MTFTTTPFQPGQEGVWLDVPADVYHAAPGVSQSELKRFGEAATPAHYRAEPPKVPTPDMEFGTVCHCATLEPDKLKAAYYVRPAQYPAVVKKVEVMKPWNGNSKWCEQWLDAHADRRVITAEREAGIGKIIASLRALTEFNSALENGLTEVSFFKRDTETGLLLKCRADCACESKDGALWLFDPKKVQSGGASHENFADSAWSYGYHIQCAAYKLITGAARMVFVPFDDDAPYLAAQWEPNEAFESFGLVVYRRLLRQYAACVTANSWPGYADGIKSLAMPHKAEFYAKQEAMAAWMQQVEGK